MKVSICIPVYNVEKYIRRCLESVEDQTYQNIEIIVVNDCSPDNSMAVVQEFAQADSRIVLLNHESNKGLMMARKTAYMNATGDYITFLDSDDYLPSTSIENLVYAIHTTGADVVSGCIEYIPCIGEKEIWQNELKYGSDSASVLKSLLKKEFGHNLCGKIFKRELLQCNSYTSYNNFNNGEDGMLFYYTFDKYSDGTVKLSSVDIVPAWVDKKGSGSSAEYILYPLENENSYSQFSLSANTAKNSYTRTKNIVASGLTEIQQYLGCEVRFKQ